MEDSENVTAEVVRIKNKLSVASDSLMARLWHNANARQRNVFKKAGYEAPPPATPTTRKRLFGGKNEK
jgi:hypothetical protein